MIQILLVFWIILAVLIILEQNFVRMIIYLSVFSLISSLCFFLFSAPDVALAEAVISVISAIIYIVSFERYYSHSEGKKTSGIMTHVFALLFAGALFALVLWLLPETAANPYLKNQYLSSFSHEIGGENAVTSIYLGYRLYDTLFEALMLLISISAVIHLSWYTDFFSMQEIYENTKRSMITVITIRIVCPIIILFSFYIMVNGHISPGGGFQGGVIAAGFFICRYMIHDIYDIPIGQVVKLEKLFYLGIVLTAMLFIFFAANISFPGSDSVFLILMNVLIGIKVACGFFVLFFRFIAFERR